MTACRNASFTLPMKLLNQIVGRADISGRSRNDEMRQLIAYGLEFAGDRDFAVDLPDGPTVRKVVYIDDELLSRVQLRAKRFHRSLNIELTLLIAHAIQRFADQDLEAIRRLMQRVGQEAPSH